MSKAIFSIFFGQRGWRLPWMAWRAGAEGGGEAEKCFCFRLPASSAFSFSLDLGV
jgi:hypothetical protein